MFHQTMIDSWVWWMDALWQFVAICCGKSIGKSFTNGNKTKQWNCIIGQYLSERILHI